MWNFKRQFPNANDILAMPKRLLAGYLLLDLFAQKNNRVHTRNIRNAVNSDYAGPQLERTWDRILEAWQFLEQERYIYPDYRDTISPEWYSLTEKGAAITDPHQLEEPASVPQSMQSLVFISCGQYAENEKAIGRRISELVEEHTDCIGYFAQNQQSLNGVSDNILRALNRAAGLVVVMHRRGSVETPSHKFFRGSVWVEQEIAIAAFLMSIGRSIPVAAYIQEGIQREGLRDLLQLNPFEFRNDDQIIADFEQKLLRSEFVPQLTSVAVAEPLPEHKPLLGVKATIVSPDEARAQEIHPISNAHRLVLNINNAGPGLAKNLLIHLKGAINDTVHVEPLAPSQSTQQLYGLPNYTISNPGETTTPEEIQVTYDGEGFSGGFVTLKRVPRSHPPRWQVAERREPSPVP